MRKFRNYLLKNHIAPKWMVFIFDTLIGFFSLIVAVFLRFNLDVQQVFTQNTFQNIVLVVLTNALFFYIFRTYQGIIRFSGFAEAVRTTVALFAVFTTLLLVNVIVSAIGHKVLIPASVLIINLLAASFMMVGYRLIVKNMYKNSLTIGKSINVLIYGAGIEAFKVKTTLEQASNYQYSVVGFIDDDLGLVGKTVDNIKIFTFSQVQSLMDTWDIGLMVFAKKEIDTIVKNSIVDFCLEHEIDVRNLPPIAQWLKGNQSLTQLKEIKIEELLGRPQIDIKNQKVVEMVSKRRVLVTGAAGSIGSELARQIAAIKPSLLLLCDQNESGLFELEYELKNNFPGCTNLVIYIGDVKDESSMETMFNRYRPEMVFHAAAYKHVPMMEFHPSEAVRNNVMGTRVLADLAIEFGVERFLLVSTDKAINPTNVMGATKRVAEIYVQSLGNRERRVVHFNNGSFGDIKSDKIVTKFITTRFGNVLGSNGSVIPRFQEQIAKGGPLTVTHPDIIRFFMTIPEACSLVLEASVMGNGGEVFIFDMGDPVKIVDLAKKMIKLSGLHPGRDIEIRFTGLRPGEKLYEELLNNQEEVISTHNKKILIAKVVEYDFYQVNKSIDSLLEYAWKNQDDEVVRQMKRIIPEYISNNSIYQAIDKESGERGLALSK